MERYNVYAALSDYRDEQGDWVKAEDAEALEQLNKKMLEVLTECYVHFLVKNPSERTITEEELLQKTEFIITKAEGA